MNPEEFRQASEAAERWLTFVSMAVRLGTPAKVGSEPADSNVDMAYRFLFVSPGSSGRPVSEEYDAHRHVLDQWVDRVRAKSDRPVEWEAGRGFADAQYWSSAHDAAVNITHITLRLLALPGWYRSEWEEEDEPVKELSPAEQMKYSRDALAYFSERVRFTSDEAKRLNERIRRERAMVLDSWGKPVTIEVTPTGTVKPANQKKNVNARMLEVMLANQDSRGWTSDQWAKHLKCTKPSVVNTQAWKELKIHRMRAKAERTQDRRRKGKGVNKSDQA